VIALLLALALTTPAAALDADVPGVAAQRTREAIDALPAEARAELRKMFFKYQDQVARRLDEGWQSGLLNDAVIEDVDVPFQPARLLEDALKLRVRELADLEAETAAAQRGSRERDKLEEKVLGKKTALKNLRRKLAREKGICRDWSDDLWSLLTKMSLDQWSVDDRRRGAPPYHTAAVACAPQDAPIVCLAFDPWPDGKASVYAFAAWDERGPGGRIPANYFLHGLPEKAP
jgi:hypothetical protein